MARVSLIKGGSRRVNARRSLELIADGVKGAVGGRQVIIKPNFVSTSGQLASTHIDHMRGMLDFFSGFYSGRIIIAEAACGNTWEAFRNFGYLSLPGEYRVELMDLNQGPFEELEIEDSRGRPLRVRTAKALLDPGNYRISAAKLKTHDEVVVTLSIKNMAMGSICLPDKGKVHQGIRQTNLNIARIAERVWPDLASIDGFQGMEGNGPSFGDPVHLGVAIAGTDPMAADRVACEVMGVDFSMVGYLYLCAMGEHEMEGIEVVGTPLEDCIRPFRLHRNVEKQYGWRQP